MNWSPSGLSLEKGTFRKVDRNCAKAAVSFDGLSVTVTTRFLDSLLLLPKSIWVFTPLKISRGRGVTTSDDV